MTRRSSYAIRQFVGVVAVAGLAVVVQAIATFPPTGSRLYMGALAVLTLLSGRLTIKVPGRAASVSVSEVFVFAAVLLFGPAVATLIVALDGACASLAQTDRRLYRALFNVAEPALSVWAAGHAYVLIALHSGPPTPGAEFLATLAMTITYFVSNTCLTAVAVSIESGAAFDDVWQENALYVAINYQAAGSLAALAVGNAVTFNLQALGLVAPLLVLSYAAYQSASTRLVDAQAHVGEIEQLYTATVETLAIAVDAKDQVTHGHVRRVQRHTLALARALGLVDSIELKALEAASLLHDVGKLAIPDHILNKPGALTSTEYATMKTHANIGATILATVHFPFPVVPIVRHHHENWDGSGYPDGISGEHIPLGARILMVVDCFDAVTSDRPYRRKLSDDDGIAILHSRRGTMYDPRVVDTFVALIPTLRQEDAAAETMPDLPLTGGGHHDHTGRYVAADLQSCSDRIALLRDAGALLGRRLDALLPGTEACLFAMDPARERLLPAFATPRLEAFAASVQFSSGEALSGWVAANRHAILNSDPRLDLGELADTFGFSHCASTPIFALGTLVGVLTVYASRAERFSDEDGRCLGSIAQEVAMGFTTDRAHSPGPNTGTPARPRSHAA